MRLHAFIYGRVQGVSLRYGTKVIADTIGAKGWIKNLPDGRVEIVAEGTKEQLDNLLSWLKKGTIFSKVEKVESVYEEKEEGFQTFEIKKTY